MLNFTKRMQRSQKQISRLGFRKNIFVTFCVFRVFFEPLTISTLESSESKHAPKRVEADSVLRTWPYIFQCNWIHSVTERWLNLLNAGAVFQFVAIPTF